MNEKTQICVKCGIEKSVDMFRFRKNRNKYLTKCTQCCIDYDRKYYENHRIHSLWYQAKWRAEQKKVDFNIEESDIVIPDVCPVLGIPIKNDSRQKVSDSSPSLDRIDSSKGYVKGNVCVISWKANNIKKHGNISDFKLIIRYQECMIQNTNIHSDYIDYVI